MSSRQTVLNIIQDVLGVSASENQTFAEMGIDSLEFVDVLAHVEVALDLKIDNQSASHIRTVRDLIEACDLPVRTA